MKKEKKLKKNKKDEKVIETKDITETKLWSSFFIILAVICFFCLFYLLTLYITRDDSKNDPNAEDSEVVISKEKTIVGRSLNMKDGEYYVIFYDGSNEEVTGVYDSLVSNYRTNSPDMSIYYVDMSSSFNKNYATSEESNKNPNSAADFKINGPTLIKVSDHKVVEYYEGEGAIKNIIE